MKKHVRRCFGLALLATTIMNEATSAETPAEKARRGEERTCFQTVSPWAGDIDAQADVAIVYGPRGDLEKRVEGWRSRDYLIHFMTGVAWGNYQDYFGGKFDGREHWAEVQTRGNGSRMQHGNSRDVFYNVPTPAYTEYMKTVIRRVVETGATAIHLEEPEFWVTAGYSDAFKQAWQHEYGEPWQPPHSSVEARYRSGRLKRKLYADCLAELFKEAKAHAKSRGGTIRCFVPTHSLINYAHWRIVSPEGNLMHIPEVDGYIAQVWTGTSRTPNMYRGERRERTFDTAFLEYGQMVNMVRPTGRRCYLLADPIEDNPNRSWLDYHVNWEATVVASLFRPENHYFEIMPWPSRIFRSRHPVDDSPGARQTRIPPDYAAEVMTVTQALGNMKQSDVEWDCGTPGIGVLVSDSIMFERGAPAPADNDLSSFYGLALPLLKHGIPVEVVSLENAIWPKALEPYDVLLLTYENQKPLKPEYHDALIKWIRAGGCLVFFDSGPGPMDSIREWWNDFGKRKASAKDALFGAAEIEADADEGFHAVGKGWLGVVRRSPRALAGEKGGADFVRANVRAAFSKLGKSVAWKTQDYLKIRRGPYVIAAVLDESIAEEPLRLRGQFIDLFDPALPVVGEKVLKPGDRALLYDLSHRDSDSRLQAEKSPAEAGTPYMQTPVLLAGAARAYEERADENGWSAVFRGPERTQAVLRLWLPSEPSKIEVQSASDQKPIDHESDWHAPSQTIRLRFPNSPDGVGVSLALK